MKDEPGEDWTEEQLDEWARHATMEELIERSSLGSPEVKAYRGITPWWIVHSILLGVYGPNNEWLKAKLVEQLHAMGE